MSDSSYEQRSAGVLGLALVAMPATSRSPAGVAKVTIRAGAFGDVGKRAQIAQERRSRRPVGRRTGQPDNVDEA